MFVLAVVRGWNGCMAAIDSCTAFGAAVWVLVVVTVRGCDGWVATVIGCVGWIGVGIACDTIPTIGIGDGCVGECSIADTFACDV